MNEREIADIIQKLQYQVSTLGQTINHRQYPVEYLILSKNWSEAQLSTAHDIFEKWDRRLESGEQMNQSAFESDFHEALDEGYQGVKPIVIAFYRNSQWTNVCEAYVDSHGDYPPAEFFEISRREQ